MNLDLELRGDLISMSCPCYDPETSKPKLSLEFGGVPVLKCSTGVSNWNSYRARWITEVNKEGHP